MLMRRDLRWIAAGLLAFVIYDRWDISQHEVRENTFTFAPDPHFRGVLNLFVQSGSPLMKYEINLNNGQGVPHPNNSENANPPLQRQCSREVYPPKSRRSLPSPDAAFAISCDSLPGSLPSAITVTRADGSLLDSHGFSLGFSIDYVAWAPGSSAVAVLAKRTRTDLYTPRGMLRLFSGHPIELTTYKVFLVAPQDHLLKEIPVPTHSLEEAWAAVDWVK